MTDGPAGMGPQTQFAQTPDAAPLFPGSREASLAPRQRSGDARSPLQSHSRPGGETGSHRGLKIPRPQGHTGSNPVPGTLPGPCRGERLSYTIFGSSPLLPPPRRRDDAGNGRSHGPRSGTDATGDRAANAGGAGGTRRESGNDAEATACRRAASRHAPAATARRLGKTLQLAARPRNSAANPQAAA